MSWWQRDDTREVDVIFGCFMMVRREAINDVGMLDERYFIFAEETDWCYRIKKAGWKILFTADIQIVHHGGQSTKHMAGDMILQLRGAQLQFMRKHYSLLSYGFACFLMGIYFSLRIPAWTVKYMLQKNERQICKTHIIAYLRGLWRLITKGGRGLCIYPKTG
jgi:GT2 family glycosyltransferase